MNKSGNERELRELIRVMEAKLGIIGEIEAACCGISFTQCHAVTEIGRVPNISLNELAEKLNLDNSTMSRTVNNLVNANLVNREIDSNDRRYITISLTDSGMEMFEKIEDSMGNYFKKIYDNIPQDKSSQVLECLRLLIDAINKSNC
ncbi:transcriptional regulator SlyA [Ruminiclostridium hungatei]|uniref:Transcriptional regulator SlyA n=1 Tax=Ruminiclostridium hungatei TaxID=48256 RepID=A0A1V4SKC9_RUMHU|nr:MarR family transcriptional regulator [Ruminiclostridium hungatei]OPX43915.1 transcriptional regulator SlyA [Ruminiclostridium hungatei]